MQPTQFAWRFRVVAGEPLLFVCQVANGAQPLALIDLAEHAARPIGGGFYGVDVKETANGFIVMEVNDNPNLEHGIEDQVGKDEIWTRVLKWFVERFAQ